MVRDKVYTNQDVSKFILFSEIWEYRYLLFTFIWRILKIRYQQTALGIIWVIIQPLIFTGIFTLILGKYANLPSESLPYPLFLMTGLSMWYFCSQGLQQASTSFFSNAFLITRIYFPKILLPLAAIFAALFDLLFLLIVLVLLMVFYGVPLSIGLLVTPVAILMSLLTILGLSLIFGTFNVKYRDIGHILPFFIQIWMFTTPVIYSFSLLPEKYNWLYAINPLTTSIQIFRWGFAGGVPPALHLFFISSFVSVSVCIIGVWLFTKKEGLFSDYI